MLPTKNQLLKNFYSCANWEEKYLYIIDLGKLLPIFPERFRTTKYLIKNCQSNTWIALIPILNKKPDQHLNKNQNTSFVKFYGDSDSVIIKGIITIIFIVYQNLSIESIINFDIRHFLTQLALNQHLTISRSQGVYSILDDIQTQSNNLLLSSSKTHLT
ncbi:cysteine desulfuration protein sufE [Candidatus Blochmanniella vafra str. BVAF]|uniref:Cysteine desulfuration protein sufE n=1 Tax=Blochmanniella vafra (strain BVAF) TaxID=859654 RepID=E8Q666_BLOVB|nr:SufE family protein [Candidatus Blochmannia vafer]ADV33760.1 cysteine desulfuration protein sufE [Candidatus Blochmannia vafer str. BVAF]